jgi:UDP-N-acetylmuramoylalanine--D-glutamate ligase
VRGRTCGAAPAASQPAVTVLVEGFEPDALAVACLLATEGAQVRLAGRGPAPLQALPPGLEVEAAADLDADLGEADVAYLDVWTPETSPRVAALRRRGVRLTCASELVLERARSAGALTVGVTGTAGKSTTAAFVVQLLRHAGRIVHAPSGGRLGNLWATGDLVDGLGAVAPGDVVVVELTSSHLAFMQTSPDLAVVTCFWPDHLELHGSLEMYRQAKETIVRHQSSRGAVAVNAGDAAALSFAALTPARHFAWSAEGPVDSGVFVHDSLVVLRRDRVETNLGPVPALPVVAEAALAAAAAAIAAGVPIEALEGGLAGLAVPPHRQQSLGRVAGVEIVDDGMATTPAKARAALAGRSDGSVVLIAGGNLETEGGPVHASADEQLLLDRCCKEIGRAVCVAVLFGEAGAALAPELRSRGVLTETVVGLADAVPRALAAAGAADSVVFAPIYPVSLDDRLGFPSLVASAAVEARVRDSRP